MKRLNLILLLFIILKNVGCDGSSPSTPNDNNKSQVPFSNLIENPSQTEDPSAILKRYVQPTGIEPLFSVAVSSDGRFLAAGTGESKARGKPDSGYGTLIIWELVSGEIMHAIPTDGLVTKVAFSPDSKSIISISQYTSAEVWDVKTGNLLGQIGPSGLMITDAVFRREGKEVIMAVGNPSPIGEEEPPKEEKNIQVYDFKTRTLIRKFGDNKESTKDLCYIEEPETLGTVTGHLHLYDVQTERRFHTQKKPGLIEVAEFLESPNKIILGNSEGTLAIMEEGRDPIYNFTHYKENTGETFSKIKAIEISPDGSLIASGGWSNYFLLHDGNLDVLFSWKNEGWVSGIAFSPDGKKVYCSTWSGYILEFLIQLSADTP